jgi:hypothetical protein
MLVLPNTPPLPIIGTTAMLLFPPALMSQKSELLAVNLTTFNDGIRYVVALEKYLKEMCIYLKQNTPDGSDTTQFAVGGSFPDSIAPAPELSQIIQYGATVVVAKEVPWNDIVAPESTTVKFGRSKSVVEWSLCDEVVATVVSISFIYCKIAGELANELIDEQLTQESQETWKKVVNFYKIAYSYGLFGIKFIEKSQFNPITFSVIIKIVEISMQMSIVAKSSWLNRNLYDHTESFNSNNNGTLARVAIFIVNEMKTLKSLIQVNSGGVGLNMTNWSQYLSLIEKYTIAYAGEFLSIEYYQQNKLGQAIGLVNFSLLTLQSKKMDEKTSKFQRLKSRFNSKKNDMLLNKLNSVSTLNLDKSVFNEKSGIVLNDLSYLFDQLIKLHLKFTKENNTMVFDTVADWKEINKDSKWPTGCQIPVSAVEAYDPFKETTESKHAYSGKGAYF